MRAIGVDYGTRKIGVAVSDGLGLGARGVTTLRGLDDRHVAARIAELAGELEAEAIVVGLPLRADGSKGGAATRVLRFVDELAGAVDVPVHTIGEWLTSFEAEERLRAMGVKESERKRRIDEAAAAIILEEYLATHESSGGRRADG
jgi:putative Holliday junction resolvase